MKVSTFLAAFILVLPLEAGGGEIPVVRRAFTEVVLTGYTREAASQVISSEVAGKVKNVNFDIGDTITASPFIELDTAFIDYAISGKTRSLERIEVQIRSALSRIDYLTRESSRVEELSREQLATESRRDALFQELDQARFDHESALNQRAVLQTELSELRERQERHRIFAPRGWIVTERNVEEQEYVQAGAPLASVSDFRTLVVPLSVSSDELAALRSGPADLDARLDGTAVVAQINWVNPVFDENTRKLAIELRVREYGGIKRGGLRLTLPVSVRAEGLHIPKTAVSVRYENPTVTVKATGESVRLVVLGEGPDYILTAEDSRLKPGTELEPVRPETGRGAE